MHMRLGPIGSEAHEYVERLRRAVAISKVRSDGVRGDIRTNADTTEPEQGEIVDVPCRKRGHP